MLYLKTNGLSKLVRHLKQVIWGGFGRLMNASHVSLEHDYEVTGLELDTLVHTAWEQEGVLGARSDRSRLWWLRHRSRKQR